MSVAAKFAAGENPMLEAAVVKELGNRFEQQLPNLIQAELDGREVPHDGEFLALLETLLQASLSFSLRGGTREIIRGLIARGLGLR